MNKEFNFDELLFSCWEKIPVRWGDMDAFGHVNNATYLTYFENARILYFHQLGFTNLETDNKFGLVVANIICNFRQQVYYPSVLFVGTKVSEIKHRSFIMEYVLIQTKDNKFDTVVADGSTAVVSIEKTSGKAIELPDNLRTSIKLLEENRKLPNLS